MEKADWFKIKDELIKLEVVSEVDLRFRNTCSYDDYKCEIREWKEKIWITCPLGCLLDRERATKLYNLRDKFDLEMEISNGEDIRFFEKENKQK